MAARKQKSKKYLITGITGFVGSHLTNLLHKEGHKVAGLVRNMESIINMKWVVQDNVLKKVKFVQGDVSIREDIERIFKEQKYDGVFHFAAQSSAPVSFKDPRGTFDTNTLGTANVIDSITNYQPKCRMVYASSAEVYGKQTGKLDEKRNLDPITPYGVSKASADIVAQERAKSTDMHFVICRGFTSTGPGRGEFFAFSEDAAQMARILANKQKPVLNHGNLKARRAVADIRDIVEGYYLLMNKGKPGEVYNIAGSVVREYGEYVDMLLRKAGLKGKVKLMKDPKLFRPIDIDVQIPVTAKIKKLGWKPKIRIDTTMKDLLDYWIERVESN